MLPMTVLPLSLVPALLVPLFLIFHAICIVRASKWGTNPVPSRQQASRALSCVRYFAQPVWNQCRSRRTWHSGSL